MMLPVPLFAPAIIGVGTMGRRAASVDQDAVPGDRGFGGKCLVDDVATLVRGRTAAGPADPIGAAFRAGDHVRDGAHAAWLDGE